MLNRYINVGAQKLRCGYTTGSCATAAAKAATQMLLSGKKTDKVSIVTPKRIDLDLEVSCAKIGMGYAECAIAKDSGDDPDITNGLLIFARVEFSKAGTPGENDIVITGGKGVGKVTKPGLDQPVGEYAINSVPRNMIKKELEDICKENNYAGGLRVVISVPEGEKIARKTYNPKMGIEGGISIIGTSGIVEPMSSAALIDTIRLEIKMRKASGYKNLLLSLGNYSENFLSENMPVALDKSVKCSNFIGEAIEMALEYEFESVLIVGHTGKLVKLGAGIMNTHSSQADGRMEVLVTCGLLAGADTEYLKKIPECVTTDAAFDILSESGKLSDTLEVLGKRAEQHLRAKVKDTIPIGAVMFSNKHNIVVKTGMADMLINKISEEYND
ncbi:MAG: cobalamin biosynthesis protein CbiD [Oscillospiraceae bacterium]|nr:cobalamin biosynthesis protein CbiD [Oscillospiraceae bacterium]